MKELVSEGRYDDIISLPYPVSGRRPRMSNHDRAAQFAPFKALVELDGEIAETARFTDERGELSEDQQREINETLCEIKEKLSAMPAVRAVYFRPDAKKKGGAYLTAAGRVRRIDENRKKLLFADGRSVEIGELFEIEILSEEKGFRS